MPGTFYLAGNATPQQYTNDGTPNSWAQRDSNGGLAAQHLLSLGTIPTAVAGSNAGTSPPSPAVASGSTDTRGTVTGGTGTSPAAGALIAITFNQSFVNAPVVNITPANAATAALAPYVTSVSATGFTIAFGSAPSASQPNTTYAFSWHAIG